MTLERWKVCDLSEGVSQVTVNDPVIEMFLLVKKFTYLVAEGKDNDIKCFEWYGKKMHIVKLKYAQWCRLFPVTHNLAFSASISSLSSLNWTTLPTCSSSNRTYTRLDVCFYSENIPAQILSERITTPEEACTVPAASRCDGSRHLGSTETPGPAEMMYQTFMGHHDVPKQEIQLSFTCSWKFGSSFKQSDLGWDDDVLVFGVKFKKTPYIKTQTKNAKVTKF